MQVGINLCRFHEYAHHPGERYFGFPASDCAQVRGVAAQRQSWALEKRRVFPNDAFPFHPEAGGSSLDHLAHAVSLSCRDEKIVRLRRGEDQLHGARKIGSEAPVHTGFEIADLKVGRLALLDV